MGTEIAPLRNPCHQTVRNSGGSRSIDRREYTDEEDNSCRLDGLLQANPHFRKAPYSMWARTERQWKLGATYSLRPGQRYGCRSSVRPCHIMRQSMRVACLLHRHPSLLRGDHRLRRQPRNARCPLFDDCSCGFPGKCRLYNPRGSRHLYGFRSVGEKQWHSHNQKRNGD